ncbi:hypothetical protein R1sor_013073 [Riccia sorocarpa]|uniref:Uncharacterized protein n=1 Tax=Riccia sorocarpa TaxID=122646 RepID=A0ABD3HBK5_9MARC
MKQTSLLQTIPESTPMTQAVAGPSKPTRKPKTVAAKDLDVSITVGIPGEDVSGETFDKLAEFMEQNPKMSIIALERVCVRSLKDKGLHTVIGIIGYCLKDEKEEHFKKNISLKQMEEGRRMHSMYCMEPQLQLTPTSVLTRALQYRKYRARSPVSTTFRKCIREMIMLARTRV